MHDSHGHTLSDDLPRSGIGTPGKLERMAGSAWRRVRIAGAVLFCLVLAVAFRLALVPPKGQPDDLLIGRWGKFAALYGTKEIYDPQRYAAFTRAEGVSGYLATPTIYPPFLINVLAVVGKAYRTVTHEIQVSAPSFLYALRTPAVLADVITALIVFALVRRHGGTRLAIVALVAYGLSPAIAYTSGWIGQFDSVYSLFLLLALLAVGTGHPVLAGICFALALLTKLQAGAILPIVAVALWRREGWSGLWRASAGAAATTAVVGATYIAAGNVPEVIDAVTDSFGFYPYLSFGAFNFWLVAGWIAVGLKNGRYPDTATLWLNLTPRDLGLLLLAVTTALIAYRIWRHPSLERITIGAAIQVFAFFLLATEMHERYIFPALPLLAIWLGRRLPTFLYIALSATYFVNFYVLFWSWQPLGYLLWLDGWSQVLVAVINCVLFGLALWWYPRLPEEKVASKPLGETAGIAGRHEAIGRVVG